MIFDFFDVFDIRNFTPDLLFFVYQNNKLFNKSYSFDERLIY